MKIAVRKPLKSKYFLFLLAAILILFHFYYTSKTAQIKVSSANVIEILKSFEAIADSHGSSRSVTKGHKATMEYVMNRLKGMPSLDVTQQPVMLKVQVDESPPKLGYKKHKSDTVVTFKPRLQVATVKGSGSCRLSQSFLISYQSCPGKYDWFKQEYQDVKPGWVALIDGADSDLCSPCDRLISAIKTGAHGAIFVNRPGNSEGYPHPLPPSPGRCGRTSKYRDYMKKIGIVSLSDDAAFSILNDIAGVKHLRVDLEVISTFRDFESFNIIATSKAGNSSSIVLFGSHLDSVPAGPGINDDGSGSASTLEMARAFDASTLSNTTIQQIRFAWWTGEEIGLLGSEYYVTQLKKNSPNELKAHKINIDTDMIASPNYVRGVWDGTIKLLTHKGSNIPNEQTRKKSLKITKLIEDYFTSRGLPVFKFLFNSRSDFQPFLDSDVPAGGVITGEDEIKSIESERLFGGVAGMVLDPCYRIMFNLPRSRL
jgi:Peptidase family M28